MNLKIEGELILRGKRVDKGRGVIIKITHIAENRFQVDLFIGIYHPPLWIAEASDAKFNPLTLEDLFVVVEKACAKPYTVLGKDYVVFKPSETQMRPAEITQTPPSPESQKVVT